jgi:four helix bundle protein
MQLAPQQHMARDHRKLRVFQMADSLVLRIYKETRGFPDDERYGLRAQIRRAAVSTAANIVEGSARRREGEYCNFLNIATGSASEVQYLVGLAARLGYLTDDVAREPRAGGEPDQAG